MNEKETRKEHMIPSFPYRGLDIARGEGVYLYDEEDRQYLDCASNFGVNILGHNHPALTKALTKQTQTLVNLHGSFGNATRRNAVSTLSRVLPSKLSHVYFTNSGTEAVEAALKFALLASGRNKFISAHNAYHGKTLGALSGSTSSSDKYRKPFSSVVMQNDFIDYGDIESLRAVISNDHAAVILEPVQGEGGIIIPPEGYLAAVRALCDEHEVLLIMDEIQTGLGRTGDMFAFERSNIIPDIVLLGKGVAGGIPAGVVVTTADIASKIPTGIQTSTMGGNPLAMAGIVATLETLVNEEVVENAQSVGVYFLEKLQNIESDLVTDVRGIGLMLAIDLNIPALPFVSVLQKKGIMAIPTGDNTIRFLPPLTIENSHIDTIIETLTRVLR